jgi:quinohemoprotein ethanol dehydrogenase
MAGTMANFRKLGALSSLAAMMAASALAAGAGAPRMRFGAVDDTRMLHAAGEPDQWLVNGGTFAGTYYSPLDQINLATVKDLSPAWTFDYDTNRGQEAEPIEVDGVLYVSTALSKVYALDAVTGRKLWFFDPQVPGRTFAKACCDAVNRGVAVYQGKVYVGTIDGRLIALDARTGRQVWSTQTTDPTKQYSITGAPRVIHGKVIIGSGGADNNVRGYVAAYDAATGKQVWRFYTVPGNPADGPDHAASDDVMRDQVARTWFGEWWKYGGGATAWNTIAYDPEFNQLLIGTGNASPWPWQFRSAAKGDNLFLASIIAVDPDTGKYKWHYQENPSESWDYSAVMPMTLTDMTFGGKVHKVVMQAPKNGFFYIIDRANGKLLSANPFVAGITWASKIDLATGRPVETPGLHYLDKPFRTSPAPPGAHNWYPSAYSAKTGLIYIATRQSYSDISAVPNYRPEDFISNVGVAQKGGPIRAYLQAFDPKTGKTVWKDEGVGGGTLATAGGLVFRSRGAFYGELVAYRATDGKIVWKHDMPNGTYQAPITYRIKGVQYIAVNTGMGGPALLLNYPMGFERTPGRMIVFKLGGKAKLPADPGAAPPLNPSGETFDPAQVAHGGALFGRYCQRCHGREASNANVVPDLRRSGALPDKATWQSIVYDGALQPSGMISWSHTLSRDDVEALRAYVNEQARTGKAKGDPVPSRAAAAKLEAPDQEN